MQPVDFLKQWKDDMLTSLQSSGRVKSKIKWTDHGIDEHKHKLVASNSDDDLLNKEESKINKVESHKK